MFFLQSSELSLVSAKGLIGHIQCITEEDYINTPKLAICFLLKERLLLDDSVLEKGFDGLTLDSKSLELAY